MAKVRKWLSFRLVLTILTYSLFSFGRIIHSISKLASDPSYDFVEEINRLGIRSFISGTEGYIQIGPRIIAYIAHYFPLQNQAVVLSSVTTLLFIGLAILANKAVSSQSGSFLLGYICGAILLLVPAASESTVGNHGSVKWSVITVLCVVLTCPLFIKQFPKTTIAFVSFSVLCSPLAILSSVSIFLNIARNRRSTPRIILQVAMVTIGLTGIQFVYWLNSGKGSRIYGGDIQYMPWSGMGQFWWSLLLTPPVFIIGSLMVLTIAKIIKRNIAVTNQILLIISTTLITCASYVTTGIKDSTAVAWQSLSWIVVVLTLHSIFQHLKYKSVGYIAILLCTAFFTRSIEKWYPASWYLTDAKPWSNLVEDARGTCSTSEIEIARIELLLSVVEIPCTQMLEGKES
jgi:hypothetical protein